MGKLPDYDVFLALGPLLQQRRPLKMPRPGHGQRDRQLIETESHPHVVQAALDVLAATADLRARSAIVAAYVAFAKGRRCETGCFARTTPMRALRQALGFRAA